MAVEKRGASGRDLSARLMGGGLSALRLVAGSPLVDRFGLRPALQKAIFEGTRRGYGAMTTLATQRGSSKKTNDVTRPTQPKLFDLTPSDEQTMMLEMLSRFTGDVLREAARDADDASALPANVAKAWQELGLAEMLLPEAYGGYAEERSPISVALVLEALGHGDAGMAWGLLAPMSVALLLLDHGTDAQKREYLPRFTAETPTIASLAIMEPTVLFDPRNLSTVAERAGNGWVLHGRKTLVARAEESDFYVVAARTDRGPALFIVDAKATGVRVVEEPPMGLRSAGVADIELTAVTVPDSALVGGDISTPVYHDVIERSRTAWCAVAAGTAAATAEFVGPYANERVAFGEPISHRQAVAFMIADMAIETQSMRLTMLRAASRLEYGMEAADAVAVARRLSAEKGMYIGTNGVQLLGGHGFVKEYLMELWYRNLRGAGLMEGGLYI